MNSVTRKLEEARKDLLDLGLRNTLLNYRTLKTKGVEITDELPQEIFRILVQEGRSMSFLPTRDDPARHPLEDDAEIPASFALAFPESGAENLPDRHADNKLQTIHTPARLQRRLLNSFYAARTALEEQGVNILFLALGMLEWFEDENSEIVRKAPLLLLPVSLTRSSVRAGFRVQYTGDDIDTNISLQMKLRLEFGADLPDIGEEPSDTDLRPYFSRVADAVKKIPRWKVDESAIALGFFSFSKLMMYKDLDESNWPNNQKPSDHPVLKAILDGDFSKAEPLFPDGRDLDDSLEPADLYHIRDADSSQTAALEEAKAGRNLVIQGPPGTGKSQTISNLIAELIVQHKTVLFVSEKMAALEVVKRRLDQSGLGAACIELHSHKTNKKAFLNELERTLRLGRPRHDGRDEGAQELKYERDRLNEYCRSLHRHIADTGVTPYRAYGELLFSSDQLGGEAPPRLDGIPFCEWPDSKFHSIRRSVEELQALLRKTGPLLQHPFWGSGRKVFLPQDQVKTVHLSEEVNTVLEALLAHANSLTASFKGEPPADLLAVRLWLATAQTTLNAPELAGFGLRSRLWLDDRAELRAMIEEGKSLASLHKRFDQNLYADAWQADMIQPRQVLEAFREKWWRMLSGEYRAARRAVRDLCSGRPPRRPDGLIEIADAILRAGKLATRLDSSGARYADVLGRHWREWRSNWAAIETVADYLALVHDGIRQGSLREEIIDYLEEPPGSGILLLELKAAREAVTVFEESFKSIAVHLELDPVVQQDILKRSFSKLQSLFETWKAQAARVHEIVTWNHLREAMAELDIEPVLDLVKSWQPSGDHLTHAFDHARYADLLDQALRERPELASFNGETHSKHAKDFRRYDEELLELNRAYVARQHWEHLPRQQGPGQLAVLRGEFQKKRRHRPIRQLVTDAGAAIQQIKPVFMMSPLSVAAYIPPGTVHFDAVIFDEASQVRPVDAFGAVIRGEQSIVVGDSRQLPPTTFFDKMGLAEEEAETWDTGAADLESVLGLFVAHGATEAMLRWHYRSRHQSLIAVSNHEFYDDRLVVFPAADDTREDFGLIFHHLKETAYERGKAINRGEAGAVAKAVMEHARKRPNLTLGVATFSLSQRQAVEDQLEILRHQDPHCEEFFTAHPDEPFFVKNLENVQGDERDVILISVGYGRTVEGYLAMNFGPLNQDGGERRLNVLISRARRRCEVYSNITGEDIDLNRTNARGVVALKTFLRYAETGILDTPSAGDREPDSPFEEEVARAIRRLGYEVHHQIGSGGFFIDLAVVDAEKPGRYMLGIECDGATYHRARWARDRDRLRQDVLEGLGWRIHRIWSTDWFRDPDTQLRKVVESIEKSKVLAGSATGVQEGDPGSRTGRTNIGQPVNRDPVEQQTEGLKAAPYQMASIQIQLGDAELHRVPRRTLAEWIFEIVEVESPVHIAEVASRIATAAGVQRVGRRIREAVKDAVRVANRREAMIRKDSFLWREDMQRPPVRDRSALPASSRKIERIAPEELEEAVLQVVQGGIGVKPPEAIVEACRLLGYAHVTENLKGPVDRAVRALLSGDRLRLNGGFLFVP